MSVKHILDIAAPQIGLNPSVENQRNVLLRFLNQAAEELYIQSDMVGSLWEQLFLVNGDQTISLPTYVGHIRAMREFTTQIPWTISQMRPRYAQQNWTGEWRNWRLKGRNPLQKSIENESKLVINVPSVETTPITVTITGSTALASCLSEVVTVDAVSVQTTNSFLTVESISKSVVTNYDIIITDVDDEVMTVIPNNELQAWYQIVDVSSMPWLSPDLAETGQDYYVEILYKKALPYLSADGDEFPAQGHDYILANKMLQIWAQESGKAEAALAYDQLVTRSLARKQEDANRGTRDTVSFVPNPHDNMLPRIGNNRFGHSRRFKGYH